MYNDLLILFTETYAMSSNPYLYLWVMASIVSTCYSYTWDIKMDWGLLDKGAGDNKFLREEVVYSSGVSFSIISILLICFYYIVLFGSMFVSWFYNWT